MGIFSRTRDIVAANITDLLDKAEDPAKMIRMIILEMEETLVEVRASAARTIADQKEMRRQITKLERLQESWIEKAELALSKGRDDLAKAALYEKQKAADMTGQLQGEIEVLDEALRSSEADIAKLQNRLREARARQNAVMTRMESAQNRTRLRELHSGSKLDEAMARFDTLDRHADLAEGQAEALGLVGELLDVPRQRIVGLVAMHVDHQAARRRDLAELGDGALRDRRKARPDGRHALRRDRRPAVAPYRATGL